ncbi:uncharacterized protein E0L32_003862 [Thyridium curvatum]|uniref:Uncharacterized protein n=1 Tax=Thyridium curvatum TaxID=1093900 RepID=A0A507BIS9_9PEZI|nr:uncharacterized protein E0L32_003862 [Thyridium curvatum]TPX16568.1 hypothetical protein E0L32_003862 [Thyridium curvatum]
MATGDTAVSMPISSPPPLLDRTPSNISSPLSEVEDKDGEPEDMDLDLENQNTSTRNQSDRDDDDAETGPVPGTTASGSDGDGDSNLSELDINESEAETERLEDTPRKKRNGRNASANGTGDDSKHFVQSRDRPFEPSPSKLKQQIQVDVEPARNSDEEDDAEEEGEEELSEEEAGHESDASSQADGGRNGGGSPRSASQKRAKGDAASTNTEDTSQGASSSETRKRKRSLAADQSESDQPLRKRVGSVGVDRENTDDKTVLDDDTENISTNPQSRAHSSDEDNTNDKEEHIAESIETPAADANRARKSKRHGAKRRKGFEDSAAGSEVNEELADDDAGAAEDETTAPGEDEQPEGEVDEEAEIAHKNEEEMERKRAAFEQLQSIEKHFATFRERLYQERLAQLTEEEAMLTGDNPTHPEYLAMMQCIDARRDERQRVIDLEYQFNMDTTKRWAVARRAQIHGQYFQSIRQSREDILEDLGRQWYQIQQQRRKHANNIPDFGIRFPMSKPQRVRNAIAYNKEVSILSGVAKHEGFPAAPQINGASAGEMDEDLEEILKSRPAGQQVPGAQPSFQDLSGLTFHLGAAGHQYLADTPWANPNHPAHQAQRPQATQEPRIDSPAAGPSDRRHSHQPGGLFSSSTNSTIPGNAVNGDSPVAAKPRAVSGADIARPAKSFAAEKALKHEPVV